MPDDREMSAVLDSIADLSEPATAAEEIQRLNDRLAGERTIPAEIADAVRERVALESIRQSLAAIAEREPVSDERNPKQIVQWLAERTEVSQSKLADLLGVSARQLQRWLSATEPVQPEGEDARKVRLVARVVNQLRFVLTPAGTVDWFSWPRSDLDQRRPLDLLDDPAEEPTLAMISGATRSQLAS
jgi:uncharacterized protein (DUF2384 family)